MAKERIELNNAKIGKDIKGPMLWQSLNRQKRRIF